MAQEKQWLGGIRAGSAEECKAGDAVRWLKRPKVSHREAQKLPAREVGEVDAGLAD